MSIGGFRTIPDYDIDDCLKKDKILGGICDATGFLACMGMLNNVSHTANGLADIQKWVGDKYTGEEHYLSRQAVRDKNVITANGTATLEFAKEIMLALNTTSLEKINEWYNFHKLGYYNAPLPEMKE